MSTKAVEFTSPVGRIVWGSLYEPNTKDFDGNPLTIKKGPDAGKPTQRYEFGLAILKTQAHFANEPGWGQLVWSAAHAAFPGGDQSPAMRPDFSWKITDGDSTVIPPKSKSKVKPCDREGFKGHWVLKYSSSFAPKIYDGITNPENPKPLAEYDAQGKLLQSIVPGYAVEVLGTVAGNTGNSPGIYINHIAVALRRRLPEIRSTGVDITGKFGGAVPAAYAAISEAPAGSVAFPAPSAPAPAPGVPGAPAAAPVAAPAPAAAAAAPLAVVPAPSLVGIPPAAAAPPPPAAAPAPAPAPAAPVSRPPHKGIPYESYIAANWTIEQLRADGYVG